MILKHLLHYFLHAGILMFAAGAPVIVGGEGAGEEVEAPAPEGGEGEEIETTEGGEEDGGGEEEGGAAKPTAGAKDEKIDWRIVPADVKAHIQAIAAENPKLGNLLQNAVYTSQTFLKEFPGGLKEAQKLKADVEEVGGFEEVKTLRATHQQLVDEQESMDNQARTGDPAVLDNLVSIAGNDGFSKLMPTAIDRWASTDPDNYSHVMGKVVVSAMREGGVIENINLAFKMLGLKTPEATDVGIEALKKVAEWANKVGSVAAKAPEKPKVDPQIASQQEQINNEKAQIFNQKFSDTFGGWRNDRIRTEVAAITPKDRNHTDFQMNTIGNRVVEEIKGILTSDAEYQKNLKRIYDSRNMAELLKFTKARTDKLLPEAVKKVYRSLYSDFTGKKKVVVTPAKGAPVAGKEAPAKGAPAVKGWTKVKPENAPKPDDIDRSKTDFAMGFRKQAILKNGQQIYWGDKIPK